MNIVPSRRQDNLGATLIEVMITTGVFSVLMLVLFTVVQYGMDSWRSIEGRTVTQTMMRKVGVFAMDDIRRASFGGLGVAVYKNYTPSGFDKVLTGTDVDQDKRPLYGQALWMLSAYNDNSSLGSGADPEVVSASERFSRSASGIPNWNKNVIYYVSTIGPNLHKEKYGGTMQDLCGGADSCPHKWLIRCEVPGHPNLLDSSNIGQYVVRPESNGGQINLFTNPELKKCKIQILADCIVAFRVVTSKPEVTLVIKSARLAELRRAQQQRGLKLGKDVKHEETVDMSNAQALRKLDTLSGASNRLGAYTLQYDITVIPRNNVK
ncbi:TPA: hypothetical protein DD394_06510 [bacterium UBP9_UBA11836]|nr:hypothetical protein [bacterium UBP9_UBA11836]